jgi:hypothetical protein
MKEEILNSLRLIQSTLTDVIYPLQEELEYSNKLKYYWDVLDFISWVNGNHPDKYELYYLEDEYNYVVNFGWLYINAIYPKAIEHYQKYGLSGIALSTEHMATELWNHVVSLESDDKIELMYKMMVGINQRFETDPGKYEPSITRIEAKVDTLIGRFTPVKSNYKTKQEERQAKANAEINKMLAK